MCDENKKGGYNDVLYIANIYYQEYEERLKELYKEKLLLEDKIKHLPALVDALKEINKNKIFDNAVNEFTLMKDASYQIWDEEEGSKEITRNQMELNKINFEIGDINNVLKALRYLINKINDFC